jgi:hypothetical protein
MVLGQLCGNALGCVHAVENNADCGTTQHCSTCILRQSILQILTKKEAVYQRVFPQEFVIDGKSIRKHFQVTTKTIDFTNKEMVLVKAGSLRKKPTSYRA